MLLAEWARQEGLTKVRDVARRIGAHHITTGRWLAHDRIPSDAWKMRIYDATRGAVTPNDWLIGTPRHRLRMGGYYPAGAPSREARP